MLRLVNTAPGKDSSATKPGGPYHFGVRNTGGNVPLGTVEAYVGTTDLRLHGSLPEADPLLTKANLLVSLRSVERIEPEGSAISVSTSQGRLLLTREESSPFARCIYELRVAIDTNASLLGYLRFRRKAWSYFQPDWCDLPGMAGIYFGLSHGQYNTAAYTFLQDGNHLVLAGVMESFGNPRYLQEVLSFPWQDAEADEPIELFISSSNDGFPGTSPPNVSTIDVWASTPSFGPVRLARYPTTAFGQRPGQYQEQYATLFIGNAGHEGDVLEIEDWGLFTDFRPAVLSGDPITNNSVVIRPDNPVTYRATSDARAPHALTAQRWFFSTDPGSLTPSVKYGFQPGRRSTPLSVVLTKPNAAGHCAYERDEPGLKDSAEGFLLEAFMAGQNITLDHITSGIGMEVDDGKYVYRLVMIENILDATYGLAVTGNPATLEGYLPLPAVDFTSLKLVKMILDRTRSKLRLYIDGSHIATYTVGTDFLPRYASSGSQGRVRLGHLLDLDTRGDFILSLVNFQGRYLAYEAEENQAPTDANPAFTADISGSGTSVMGTDEKEGNVLVVSKPDNAAVFSKTTYFSSYDFSEFKGAFVEMRVRVPFYTDLYGTPLAKNVFTGVGVRLHMGTSFLQLGFYDAGIHGRMFGIDFDYDYDNDFDGEAAILQQTGTGKLRSVQIDWTEWQTYRIHYRAYDSIQVWVGSIVSDPTIVIPWTQRGFRLNSQSVPKFGIEFGHLSADEASLSHWSFLRWGTSSGYDISVEQLFPNGPKDYQFDGKSLYQVSFGDGGPPGGPL